MVRTLICSILFLINPSFLLSIEDPVKLSEDLLPGLIQQIETKSTLEGTLQVPVGEGEAPKIIPMKGNSRIRYKEILLQADPNSADFKSLRTYQEMIFERKNGDRDLSMVLRPEVRGVIFMKKNQAKNAFSPNGSLTWDELDGLRTDQCFAALQGIFPSNPVLPGDRWRMTLPAVQELTDLEVSAGRVECIFEEVIELAGRKVAHVRLEGKLKGVNEDGPVEQNLTGKWYFDLEDRYLSYLSIHGQQSFLNKDGKTVGKITGQFVLSRRILSKDNELTLLSKKLKTEPDESNTRLLYINPDLHIRFIYPRNWHVSRVQGRQITLDEKNGAGLLITVDPPEQLPKVADFQKETSQSLLDRKATIQRTDSPTQLRTALSSIDKFSYLVNMNQETVLMSYAIVRTKNGGGIFAARIPGRENGLLQKQLSQMAETFVMEQELQISK